MIMTSSLDNSNILIVDDTPDALRLLAQMLSQYGYKIRVANNAAQALDAVQSKPPDLILLDVMLPDLNGYQVCAQLKANPTTREIPVIFLSALNQAIDKVKAFTVGGVDYVSKPFDQGELVARVETHLALQKMRQRLEERNAALQRAQAELEQHRLHLEERIVERTAELSQTNQQLAAEIAERQQVERELAQSREQLRNLAEYLQTAREQERTTIAREIHDEFGQALTALKMDLAWLTRHLNEPAELPAKINSMSSLVDDTIRTVRRIATELRPGLLDDLGLVAAIEWQTQEFARRTGLAYTLRLGDHDLELEPDLATALFRILQEALTNIARHAEATHVAVELDDQPNHLTLVVRDDGKGITPGQLSATQSLGLMGMRERARVWGGQVTVEGIAGQGTTVAVRIPQPSVRAHALEALR
jgi:signal transduction histidine kinase